MEFVFGEFSFLRGDYLNVRMRKSDFSRAVVLPIRKNPIFTDTWVHVDHPPVCENRMWVTHLYVKIESHGKIIRSAVPFSNELHMKTPRVHSACTIKLRPKPILVYLMELTI